MVSELDFRTVLHTTFQQPEVRVGLLISGKYCDKVCGRAFSEIEDQISDQDVWRHIYSEVFNP